MRNKKFDFNDTREPSYLFDVIARVFWIIAGAFCALWCANEIGKFLGEVIWHYLNGAA